MEKIDFTKIIKKKGKKPRMIGLPSNIFVREFEDDEFDKSRHLRDYVRKELKRIFKKCGVSSKYFILVGQKWAWGTGSVKG